MNVSREKVVNIFEEQQQYLQDEHSWIWQIVLQSPDRLWMPKDAEQWMKEFNGLTDLEFELEKEMLEVEMVDGPWVLRIEGLEAISRYCQNDYFEVVPHEWMERTLLSEKHIDQHYGLNIQSIIKKERLIDIDESTLDWLNVAKYYRQSKRMIYQHSGCRYIIEYIRSSSESFATMLDADLASQMVSVQISVEFTEVKEGLNTLLSSLFFLMMKISHEPYLMTLEEQKNIVDKYHRLIQPVRDLNKYEKSNPTSLFLAPKPVSFEKKNLIDPETSYGVVSILHNYTVTDKADGERMLMYVDDQGDVYLINNTFNVRKTGIRANSPQLYQSLFDGEYIPTTLLKDTERITGKSKTNDLFAIFDVYFIHQQSVMNLPLMADSGKPNRYDKMKTALDPMLWDREEAVMTLEMKEHIHAEGKDMLMACRTLLESKRRYDIDGLIFTPVDLPVFAYYPNQFKKIRGKSVSWDRVFKWKPPEQNTIDFLVKEEPELFIDEVTQKRYKRYKLYTGYNASQWEEIPVWKGVQRVFYKDKTIREEEYQAKVFKPIEFYTPSVSTAFVPIQASGQAMADDGTQLQDHMIVEFSYNAQYKGHPSMRWTANRVRMDKTRLLRMTGQLSKTANDLSVAYNIWHNIHDPVTYEHITGQLPVTVNEIPTDIEERLLGTNDVYYARDIPRNHLLSVHMLNFHNYGIKSYLYSRPEAKDSLLELAVGMAGDLPRWKDHRYNFILGVDLVKNNIESPQGSYARYLYQREEFMKKHRHIQRIHYPQAIFVIGDCSLPLETGEASKGKDYDSEVLLKTLFMGKVTDKYSYLNQYRIPGRAARKFDVVSCQFAIHYFFSKKERLEGFLRNVSFNLKPNGKFILTFMDGVTVHKAIQKEGFVKGVKEDKVVWCIQKQYKSFNKANVFGRMIDVFLENTNHFIPEYLVHFDVLKEKAKEYHLEIVEDGFFSDTFQMLKEKMVNNDPRRNQFLDQAIRSLDQDPEQTRFSFLNRWAIFRKMEEREIQSH